MTKEMLLIILHCALVLLFFVDFHMLLNHLLFKKTYIDVQSEYVITINEQSILQYI